MWLAVESGIRDLWPLLPQVTAALRFAAALIGFVVTLITSTRRVRRWTRAGRWRRHRRRGRVLRRPRHLNR
jgi:hypothetical protein